MTDLWAYITVRKGYIMELTVQELDREAFAPYGTYFDIHKGYNEEPVSFIPDRMLHYIGTPALDSLCSIRLRYRNIEIDVTEYHNDCEEVFGGFNCDIVFHVGLLDDDGKPDLSSIAMFRLPAGAYARVKRKVLHHAGFVLHEDDVADGLVILSPAAYTIDCRTIKLGKAIPVNIARK
jgi:ureidoglycolate hydrolase